MPPVETNNQGIPVPSDNEDVAWRHDEVLNLHKSDFNSLKNVGDLTLQAWLEIRTSKTIPTSLEQKHLTKAHFIEAKSRFAFNGKNLPTASYHRLLQSLDRQPHLPAVVKRSFSGEQLLHEVALNQLLATRVTDSKHLYHKGIGSFLVFVNAVMIAIEEASANTALPPQDPTRS